MVEGELSQLPVQFGREPKKHPFRRTRGGSAPSDGCACQRGPHHALRRQGWISGPGDRAEGGGLQVFGKTGRNGRINVSPDHPLDQTFWLFCALSTALRKRSKSLAALWASSKSFESRSSTPSNSTRSRPGWRSTSGGAKSRDSPHAKGLARYPAISGLFGNRSAAMGLGPGGRLDSLSFTGRRGCVRLLDAEYFCSFSYIRGLDP